MIHFIKSYSKNQYISNNILLIRYNPAFLYNLRLEKTKNMSVHNELGNKGEEIAIHYLKEKGYKILEQNWRFDHKEIDIIAQEDETIVIIEVKTRSSDYFEKPGEAVTLQKQKYLVEATEAYLEQNNIELNTRFDVISIIIKNKETKIEHIKFAFYPVLDS